MEACKMLVKFSRLRQAHFEHSGFKTAAKMAAISKIQRVASFFGGKSPAIQLRAVTGKAGNHGDPSFRTEQIPTIKTKHARSIGPGQTAAI